LTVFFVLSKLPAFFAQHLPRKLHIFGCVPLDLTGELDARASRSVVLFLAAL
jgi:hypothetical protein